MAESNTKYELAESHEAIDLVPTWELEWWWIALPVAALVMVGLLGYFLLRKTRTEDPNKNKREAFQQALSELAQLDASLGKENVIMVSLAMRKYLAKSMNEPALYETHEEFIGRHDAIKDLDENLKSEISAYFTQLAAIKYGPGEGEDIHVDVLKQSAINLLERIHSA